MEKLAYVMNAREQKLYNTLKKIWYDVSEVQEKTENIFFAVIPRGRIDMNNLIQLQGELVWHNPYISLNFYKLHEVEMKINFQSYE